MNLVRRWTIRFVWLIMATALGGCYESAHPLAAPGDVPRDAGLLGTWRCVPDTKEKSDDKAILQVVPFGDVQYDVEWKEEEKVTRYRAYGVRAGRSVLLNVQELTTAPPAGKWVFVRYRFEAANTLRLAVVQDTAVKGRGEAEQLLDIRGRAAEQKLYESFAVCRRE